MAAFLAIFLEFWKTFGHILATESQNHKRNRRINFHIRLYSIQFVLLDDKVPFKAKNRFSLKFRALVMVLLLVFTLFHLVPLLSLMVRSYEMIGIKQ